MRAGGCTVQQTLTADAANVVKEAVTLAKRRGHAQVTPLHVANTILSPPASLLRTACLQSQSNSHPLQCKALELCFNVALNRLPASFSGPMLAPQSQYPSISNALIAAFKRAQAHQRRGSIESQQQPLLAVKIELEQLIISILDDPSVSRVMREAGFSSTQVKRNVEKEVSLELCSQTLPPKSKESDFDQIGSKLTSRPRGSDQARSEDVMTVIEKMMSDRRSKSIAIVGECIAAIEGVVGGIMDKVDRGEVPEGFREVKFISLPLFSLGSLSREKVEEKLVELRCLVKSCVEKGVVLYLGDLKWTTENRTNDQIRECNYSPVEHMIVELGRLVCGIDERERFWLMGIATFQTYMRCRSGHPNLETVWGLHPLTIPEGSLSLSLIPDSDVQSECRSKKNGNGSTWLVLEECTKKFETEARSSTCTSEATTSSLPSWLQQYKDQNKAPKNNNEDCVPVRDLCEKWNSLCSSAHKNPYSSERTITFSSISPSCSTSIFSYDHHHLNLYHQTREVRPVFEPKQYLGDQAFSVSESVSRNFEPSLRMYIPEHKDPKLGFSSNPSSNPNSASTSDEMETEHVNTFKELNSENLKTLCNALEKKVPWQKDIIPEIVTTILQCRSGMVRRKGKVGNSEAKEETWLFFQGVDFDAKEKIARELARLVFWLPIEPRFDCLDSRSRACSLSTKQKLNGFDREEKEISPCISLDLNVSFDDESEDSWSIDDIGLLESVDKRIVFKIQEL
ncbi:double Clp-N motif-containing P-loop nucleoside triphosphate hydrolases superfamily protein [Actinidia rufa]|uniref:Double Clp-N motif-containing P-loop nucleoside triphosphate hydrolases superfamily protein n=1 Tax=Actinidia rufa TaxID=165716 RepID=A0A7J0FGX2_9ERIC|nr:double Clp-N motif-containing P-loop nucleoside triphosphate hydrolases superfamily protein [Actinidia rufa]